MHKLVHNVETGEVIEVDLSSEELAQLAIDQANAEEEQQAKAEAEGKKAAAKAKLAALGLTSDDLKALGLGGN